MMHTKWVTQKEKYESEITIISRMNAIFSQMMINLYYSRYLIGL